MIPKERMALPTAGRASHSGSITEIPIPHCMPRVSQGTCLSPPPPPPVILDSAKLARDTDHPFGSQHTSRQCRLRDTTGFAEMFKAFQARMEHTWAVSLILGHVQRALLRFLCIFSPKSQLTKLGQRVLVSPMSYAPRHDSS